MKVQIFFLLIFYSVFTNAQVTANAGSDKLVCIKDTLKATGTGLNSGDTGSYQWKDLNSNSLISSNAFLSVKVLSLTSIQYELTVNRLHNMVNYTSKDTFVLTVSPLPTFKFAGLPPRCYDDGCLNLTFGTIAVAIQGNDTSKKFYDIRYFQKYKSPSWVSGGPVGTSPFKYCPQNYLLNSQLPATGLRDTICYEYNDLNGCYNSECKSFRINPNPVVKVNNGLFCQRIGCIGLDQLAVIPFNKTGGLQTWRCIKVPLNSGVDASTIITENNSVFPATYCMDPGLPGDNKKTGDYIVEYCFKNPTTGCQRCDTSIITVIRLPEIEFDIIPGQCINGKLLALDSFVREKSTGKHISNGTWQCIEFGGSRDLNNKDVKNAINNSIISQKYFDPTTNQNGGEYMLRFTDNSSGCMVIDSVKIVVNGIPQIKLFLPDSVCSNSGKYQLFSNYSSNDTNGKWSGEHVSENMLNTDSITMGSNYSKSIKIKFNYTNPLVKCSNEDSTYYTIIKRPHFKFIQIIHQNSRFLVDFAVIDSNMNLNNFKWLWQFSDGSASNEKQPKNILYRDSGNYKVYLTINNGICDTKDSIDFILNSKTATSRKDIFKNVNFYPNPFNEVLFINSAFNSTLSISDFNGKVVFQDECQSGELKQLDLSRFDKGIYMLNVSNNNASYHFKLVKL